MQHKQKERKWRYEIYSIPVDSKPDGGAQDIWEKYWKNRLKITSQL